MINFTLLGPPIPQQRARFRRMGKYTMTYDPQSEKKKSVKQVLDIQCKELSIDLKQDNSYKVKVTFFMPIPEAYKKKPLYRFGLKKMISKPDIDNLAKFILDCANGILWSDDKQIIELNLRKCYSLNPRTELKVMETQLETLNPVYEKILSLLNNSEMRELAEKLIDLHLTLHCLIDEDEEKQEFDFAMSLVNMLIYFSKQYSPVFEKINKLAKQLEEI